VGRPSWRLGGAGSARTGVPNYLIWAILCTLFFSPIGIVGIVYSVIANRRAGAGDIDGALRASKVARTWCWVSLIIGLAGLLLVGSGVIAYPLKT